MKKIFRFVMMLAVAVAAVGCYNDFDTPAPAKIYGDEDFGELARVSIAEVKQMFLDVHGTLEHTGDNTAWKDTKYVKIEEDIYIKGKVLSNDEEGNVYKSLFLCDETGAIEVKLTNGNYLDYPTGHYDPSMGTMPSTYVYVKLNGLYVGNYRMMLSIGGAPSDSFNRVGEHKFYANSNIENPSTIAEHVFRGEATELTLGEEILEINASNASEFVGGKDANGMQNWMEKMGRLVLIKDVTCRYGTVDSNLYPSWMDTNVRPVVSKEWYKWAFNDKSRQPNAANLYGSVLFTYSSSLPNQMGKAGVYVLRTSGYARFAARPIVQDGAKGHILGILSVYSKYWANYATYQLMVNRFEDIMFDEDAFLSSQDVEELTPEDSYYTPSTEDTSGEGSIE